MTMSDNKYVMRRECEIMHKSLQNQYNILCKDIKKIELALYGVDGTSGIHTEVKSIQHSTKSIEKEFKNMSKSLVSINKVLNNSGKVEIVRQELSIKKLGIILTFVSGIVSVLVSVFIKMFI